MNNVWIIGFGRLGHLVYAYEQTTKSNLTLITKTGGERSFQDTYTKIVTQRDYPEHPPNRIWVCVPESEFHQVVDLLRKQSIQANMVIQTSGWLSPTLLLPICSANGDYLSFHPMKSIRPKSVSLEGSLISLCGTEQGIQFGKEVATALKANSVVVSAEEKKSLHLLSQFASNVPYAVVAATEEMASNTQLTKEQLHQAVRSMIIDAVDAAFQHQTYQAVTGFVARGDWTSIDESIQFLSDNPHLVQFYRGYVQYLTHYLLSKGASIEKMQQWQTILNKLEVKNVSSPLD